MPALLQELVVDLLISVARTSGYQLAPAPPHSIQDARTPCLYFRNIGVDPPLSFKLLQTFFYEADECTEIVVTARAETRPGILLCAIRASKQQLNEAFFPVLRRVLYWRLYHEIFGKVSSNPLPIGELSLLPNGVFMQILEYLGAVSALNMTLGNKYLHRLIINDCNLWTTYSQQEIALQRKRGTKYLRLTRVDIESFASLFENYGFDIRTSMRTHLNGLGIVSVDAEHVVQCTIGAELQGIARCRAVKKCLCFHPGMNSCSYCRFERLLHEGIDEDFSLRIPEYRGVVVHEYIEAAKDFYAKADGEDVLFVPYRFFADLIV